jgi:hypothetical protein
VQQIFKDFGAALDAEIAVIEKQSHDQTYELLAGQRDEKATGVLYIFLLADALRLPEDAAGTLRFGQLDVRASVVAQEGNKVWVLIESLEHLPAYIPSARLVLNETELLQRLKEKIQELAASGDFGLAPKVFGREDALCGDGELPPQVEVTIGSDTTKAALRKCIGSDVTFLWGPPGTGKTFSIAALVAAFAAAEETSLVLSHTHAAVEQALYALIEPPGDGRAGGLLADSQLVAEGRILKVGSLKSKKIPRTVHLNSYLEDRAKEREESVATLLREQELIDGELNGLNDLLAPWRSLSDTEESHVTATRRFQEASAVNTTNAIAVQDANAAVRSAEGQLAKARRSFLIGRRGRVVRAEAAWRTASAVLTKHQAIAGQSEARMIQRRADLEVSSERLTHARAATEGLDEPSATTQRLAVLTTRREQLSDEIRALRETASEDANQLLEGALAIFATLTKLYTDRTKLGDMRWDNVIIDEASMAMQPLVAFAASRAKKRVVIAGDMYQLPPIVHSSASEPGGLLGQDIFERRGLTAAVDNGKFEPMLAKLIVQRRMHPAVASVARELIAGYSELEDDRGALDRLAPSWIGALGTTTPLVIVDTTSLHGWSGKVPGSLSRFNFVSAQAAVEVASLYAAQLSEPEADAAPRIGIVTPYAAQRRYLSKLIETLCLQNWVTAGTVHTFQGNECDVIIFDSVLGEPHWTARLTDPHQFREVRRDINVAVTRTRHQFVFVGDAGWMKKNAKAESGYGKLWNHLAGSAAVLDAAALLGEGFRERIAQSVSASRAWSTEKPRDAALLTEATFYPAFARDLGDARERVVLYTPFIGKTRWPIIEPHIAALRSRGVAVYLLHKPLSDREWKQGDPAFGAAVFASLRAMGVHLIPLSGVHAKTIVIDGRIVYDGSLNWASQTSSYEHMWRLASKEMALLIERMLQLEPIVEAFGSSEQRGAQCPKCQGPLILINQTQQSMRDAYPVKLGCYNYSEDKGQCDGYLRRVDGRPPFASPPLCPRGVRMKVAYSKTGRPWAWQCGHKGCRTVRWARGDCEK